MTVNKYDITNRYSFEKIKYIQGLVIITTINGIV